MWVIIKIISKPLNDKEQSPSHLLGVSIGYKKFPSHSSMTIQEVEHPTCQSLISFS
jgi:hypothetical protein